VTAPRSPLVRTAVAIAACLAVVACSGGGDSASEQPAGADATEPVAVEPSAVYPGAEWSRAGAAEMGFDPARLDELASLAAGAGSNCLVVTRQGQVVGEWYWAGTDASSTQEVFSVTKSYASTLVGIAQEEGLLDIDDPASRYIDAWAGTDSAGVTVANLLSNDSGRTWDPNADYRQLPVSQSMNTFAIGLGQQAAPGTTWAYNNAAIQTLDAVLQAATGGSSATYAEDKLLGPLGMDDSHMTLDPAGNTKLFMGLQSSCEDMARFGYLFLRGGEWDGEQIVPAAWVDEATGAPSQRINEAYGYLWWLNHRGKVLSPAGATTADQAGGGPDTQLVPGAPEDMYFALGLGNQIIAVDPASETVVVRLGVGPPPGAAPFDAAAAARVVTEAYVGETTADETTSTTGG
jgi:CubicO group peptidase (beta-lactamase class C family)